MNKITNLLLLLFCLNCFAQYNININNKSLTDKELQDQKQLKREEIGRCKFIPTYQYEVGMKFYFPVDEFKLKYDNYYNNYYSLTQIKKNKFQESSILYKDISGKIFEIIKIFDKGVRNDTYITLKQVDGSLTIEHMLMFPRDFIKNQSLKDNYDGQISVLPDAIYVGEIDSFKDNFLNKELYSKVLVNGKRFQKIKIIEVGAGTDKKPVRAIVQDEKGNKDQIDFCTCCTNVDTVDCNYNTIEYYFSSQDPKLDYKGNDENWETICEKNIKIGFSEYELRYSWGAPDNINETFISGKKHQQFIYGNQYVYLDNGIVTSFQSLK